MTRTPLATVLGAVALLLAGCGSPAAVDPMAMPGKDRDGMAGCSAAVGEGWLELCGVRWQVANATFTVTRFNATVRMQWSDLVLEAAGATLVAEGRLHAVGEGLELGTALSGPVRKGQSFTLCLPDGGAVEARLSDTRPIGGQAAATVQAGPCASLASLDRDIQLTVSNGSVGGAVFFMGASCVGIPRQAGPWTGYAEATWSAQSPAAEVMTLTGAGNGGSGPSPLRIELASDGGETWVEVAAAPGGAAFQQDVEVHIHMESLAELAEPDPRC